MKTFSLPSIVAVVPTADGLGFEFRELVSLRGLTPEEREELIRDVKGEAEFALGDAAERCYWRHCLSDDGFPLPYFKWPDNGSDGALPTNPFL